MQYPLTTQSKPFSKSMSSFFHIHTLEMHCRIRTSNYAANKVNIQLIRLQHATIQVDLVLSQLENYPKNKMNIQRVRLQHETTQLIR